MHLTYSILILVFSIALLSSLCLFISLLLSKRQKTLTFDSMILTSKENTQLLTKWLKGTDIKNITLLYRLSRDGSDSIDFHQRCDKIPNTLTVIKVINETIIGGYTGATWEGNGFKYDHKAFIFNLSNKKMYSIFKNEHAIFASSYFLSIFGERDIFCGQSKEISSMFPRCYGNNSNGLELTNGNSIMHLIELEVFRINYYK